MVRLDRIKFPGRTYALGMGLDTSQNIYMRWVRVSFYLLVGSITVHMEWQRGD